MTRLRLLVAAVLILCLVVVAGYGVHRHFQHVDAQDAFARAFKYRDSGALLYEPRWKEFEVARDDATDKRLSECGEMLRSYRELRAEADRRLDVNASFDSIELSKALMPIVEEISRKQDELAKSMQPCLK
jgi:hypothetical protein